MISTSSMISTNGFNVVLIRWIDFVSRHFVQDLSWYPTVALNGSVPQNISVLMWSPAG